MLAHRKFRGSQTSVRIPKRTEFRFYRDCNCRTFSYRCAQMSDTRPVELVLRLPNDVADSVEEVRDRDPEYLNRVIRYGMVRRAVYRELQRSSEPLPPFAHS